MCTSTARMSAIRGRSYFQQRRKLTSPLAAGREGEFSRFSDCGHSPRFRKQLRPSTQAEVLSFRVSRANAWYSAEADRRPGERLGPQ